MKAEEIFGKSVEVMKRLFPSQGVVDAVKRLRCGKDEEVRALLRGERENINELVRKIVDAKGSEEALEGASQELRDAMVARYLLNRDIFMKTFPEGLEEIDPDPLAIWAAIMISPRDEQENS